MPGARRGQPLLKAAALLFILFGLAPLPAGAQSYAGSESCRSCHAAEYKNWQASHHYQAMLPATAENVLGDFSDVRFQYGDVNSRFFKKDGKYFVETDNASGEIQEFEIAYTFGFDPLQQYLVAFPDGRYQALNIVWDSRPRENGGQRWVHLYPHETVEHDDLVHWTGAFQNWNSRCAACHSTGLEKNYSPASDRYETRWQEINVACEACHGPASQHLDWAAGARDAPDKGFARTFSDRGAFAPGQEPPAGQADDPPRARTLLRLDGERPRAQLEMCAGCHSRRGEMDEDHAGKGFDDIHRLALIERGLYFPDGQILDEVYVYGSFLQSKMHAAGVVCSDCHEPHSTALRVEGNGLCGQCHNPAVYDAAAHHRHATDSDGAACVACHMPLRTYMVVDDRHDHGFRIPEPRLTLERGIPNTCNQCHSDQSPQWALDALQAWGLSGETRSKHAALFDDAWAGRPAALPGLLALANDPAKPAILRASALRSAGDFPSGQTAGAAAALLGSDQVLLGSDRALLRASAVLAVDWLPMEQRYTLLRDHIRDPSKLVRMTVARQLTDVPVEQLPAAEAAALADLRKEYLALLQLHADMPEEQINIGLFEAASGDPIAAEKAYRKALALAPAFVPAMLNLADLYRASGLDGKAKPLLERAVETAPDSAPGHHALGLLLIREQDIAAATRQLERAARIEPTNSRYSYVYAVALWEGGQRQKAVAELESALERQPGQRDLVSALSAYYQQLGEEEKLRRLLEANPF